MKCEHFQNEHEEAKIVVRVIRDTKIQHWVSHKRYVGVIDSHGLVLADDSSFRSSEHTVRECLEPQQLLINPLLPMLAMCIKSGAFREYHSARVPFDPNPTRRKRDTSLDRNDPDTPFFSWLEAG